MRPMKPTVEVRPRSIRILFQFRGERRRETLYIDGEPMPPTPANVKYARRVAGEIGDKIKSGIFKYEEYFPDSLAAVADNATQPVVPLLFDVFDAWLRVADLKASTRRQYRTRISSFWKTQLKNVPVDQVRHSDILGALAAGTWKSAKSRNNELSMIRGPFELAKHDKHIAENPCGGIEPKEVQRRAPDPFSQVEIREILAHLAHHRPEQIHNFVQLMFYSGLRTSEGIGLRWESIDLRAREMLIEGGNVYDEETDTTKTSKSRIVLLSAPAFEALQRQKAHTFLHGEHVFHDPKTGEPWKYETITDVRSFWKITLKRLGIRYRRPYNMRHTYATLGIMSGARPAFLANQLGHSMQTFFRVYAKWINSKDDREEIAKLDLAIAQLSPNCPQPVDLGRKDAADNRSGQ
jgi:integrase